MEHRWVVEVSIVLEKTRRPSGQRESLDIYLETLETVDQRISAKESDSKLGSQRVGLVKNLTTVDNTRSYGAATSASKHDRSYAIINTTASSRANLMSANNLYSPFSGHESAEIGTIILETLAVRDRGNGGGSRIDSEYTLKSNSDGYSK